MSQETKPSDKSLKLAPSGPDGDEQPQLLSTGDMARLTESTLRTVRFYEEAGLLQPEARTGGSHRMFRARELHKLRLILDLREAGLSLQDIRSLFELKGGFASAALASQALTDSLGHRIEEMEQKIHKLRSLQEELMRTLEVLRQCGDCAAPGFPEQCVECEELGKVDLPRAMRLLWQ